MSHNAFSTKSRRMMSIRRVISKFRKKMQIFMWQGRAVLAAFLLFATYSFSSRIPGTWISGQESRRIGQISGSVVAAGWLAEQVVGRIGEDIVKAGGFVDQYYFAPSVSEVQNLIERVKTDLPYVAESYDCDDFSRHFKDTLQRQWASEGHLNSLAIIELYGIIGLPDGQIVAHAWNAIITDEGKIIFVEPQGPGAIAFRKAKILGVALFLG